MLKEWSEECGTTMTLGAKNIIFYMTKHNNIESRAGKGGRKWKIMRTTEPSTRAKGLAFDYHLTSHKTRDLYLPIVLACLKW